NRRSRRDGDRRAAAERDRLNRSGLDAHRVNRRRDGDGADEKRRRAVLVGKANKDSVPADGDTYSFADRLAFDLEWRTSSARLHGLRARGPRGDPARFGLSQTRYREQ